MFEEIDLQWDLEQLDICDGTCGLNSQNSFKVLMPRSMGRVIGYISSRVCL